MFKTFNDLNQQDVLDQLMLTAYIAEFVEWNNRAHLERIRRYTYILASGTDIGHNQAGLISLASILHDVGKITIPASILKKTANLEPAEYKLTEQHAMEGAKLLSNSGSAIFQTGAIIARTHHERWDGSGYPDHLRGDEIPLSGQIMALVDVFDALTTKRSYKSHVKPEDAYDMIRAASGSLFDAKLVSIFSSKFEEFRSILLAQS